MDYGITGENPGGGKGHKVKEGAMGKRLLVINTDQYMEIPFEQQITIGRDIYNSLCLQDSEVSRSHAIIFEQDDETLIKDLRSRNGLYVQGERVAESVLTPGDEIIVGSTVIIFDPADTLDIGSALSKRGKYLLEKRSVKLQLEPQAPETVFSIKEMDNSILSLFSNPESTTFFSMANAVMLLQAIKEMDDAPDAAQLFECALRRALARLGGHCGIIMESNATKERVKVRSIVSVKNLQTVQIGQPILRVLLNSEKCIYCPDVARDKRFEILGVKAKRPIHSFAATPIMNQKELYGLIYLDSEDSSVSYDFSDLRSLYFIACHLGALLQTRPKHFHKQPAAAPSCHLFP